MRVALKRHLRRFRTVLSYIRYRRLYPITSLIMPNCKLHRDVVIGEFVFVGRNSNLGQGVRLDDFVMFGPGVSVLGNDHNFHSVGVPTIFSGRPEGFSRLTTIGRDVWVGANATIMRGIDIGSGSIVGAGSLVLSDVPENSIVGGVPARVLRKRFSVDDFEKHVSALTTNRTAIKSWRMCDY